MIFSISRKLESTDDLRSLALRALDAEDRADRVRAVLHDAQAHPLNRANVSREADSIVGDGQSGTAPRTAQAHDHGAGMPMFDRIGDRLLGDPVEVRRGRIAGNEDRSRTVKPAAHVEELAGVRRQLPERGHESVGFKRDGRKTPRQHPRLARAIANQFNNRGGVAAFHRVTGELLRQGRGLELDARKVLAQTVVQILADPPLLVAADVKQFSSSSLRSIAAASTLATDWRK